MCLQHESFASWLSSSSFFFAQTCLIRGGCWPSEDRQTDEMPFTSLTRRNEDPPGGLSLFLTLVHVFTSSEVYRRVTPQVIEPILRSGILSVLLFGRSARRILLRGSESIRCGPPITRFGHLHPPATVSFNRLSRFSSTSCILRGPQTRDRRGNESSAASGVFCPSQQQRIFLFFATATADLRLVTLT